MANNNFGFNQNGFSLPTLEDVENSIFQDMSFASPSLDLTDDSKLEVAFLNVMANQFHCLWNAMYNQYNSNNPVFLSGCALDLYGAKFEVSRNENESDSVYRFRIQSIQSGSGGLSGKSCFDRLYSDLDSISGITDIQINLNESSEQVGVLPPNSYEVIVLGGNSQEIAEAIWNNHPTGINIVGNTFENIIDCDNQCRSVFFTRPKIVPIFIDIRIFRTGRECGCPTSDTSVVKQAVQDYIDNQNGLCFTRIGQPVYAQDFYPAIYGLGGLGVSCGLVGRDGACASQEFVTLKRDEIPYISVDCMNIDFSTSPCENIENGICDPNQTDETASDFCYVCPPEGCVFSLDLVKEADKTEVTSVGEIVSYTFTVTNNGVAQINNNIVITDDKAATTCPSIPVTGLGIGESVVCSALYEVTYDDAIAGSVTNIAQAISGDVFSPFAELTIPYTGPDLFAGMQLTKTLLSGTCDAVGNLLIYQYTVTNTGNIPILTQPIINDNKIGGIICPPIPLTGLLPNTSVSTTAQTVVTQQMLDDGECCNTARASASTALGNLVSNAVELCITCGTTSTGNPPVSPQDLLVQDCLNDFPVDTGSWTSANGPISLSANGTDSLLNLLFSDDGDGSGTLSAAGIVQNGVVTITATDSLNQTSVQTITVNCQSTEPPQVSLSGTDCPVFPTSAGNVPVVQSSQVFIPFSGGVGPFTITSSGVSPLIFTQVGDYGYQLTTPANTNGTGVRFYSVTITDANGSSITCSGNFFEVAGL